MSRPSINIMTTQPGFGGHGDIAVRTMCAWASVATTAAAPWTDTEFDRDLPHSD